MTATLEHLIREASSTASDARRTRAAARLMTRLEREPQLLPDLFRHRPAEDWAQPRLVLGVTGAPGTGKSTVTDSLVSALRARHPDDQIGVIAVDPSSPYTGGAVLGDRVRMMRHATDPRVFIRSLATRGHLGGLSLGVKGVLRVMGLMGCDVVIVETVGVGQSEVEIARVADLVAIVLAPGHGDNVQLLKAGLMEVGDLFIVNKADRDGADHLHAALLSTLSMDGRSGGETDRRKREIGSRDVFMVVATEGTGIDPLVDYLDARIGQESNDWLQVRSRAVAEEVADSVLEEIRRRSIAAADPHDFEQVLRGATSVSALADELMRRGANEHPDKRDDRIDSDDRVERGT